MMNVWIGVLKHGTYKRQLVLPKFLLSVMADRVRKTTNKKYKKRWETHLFLYF
ncbi:hypothetical protein ACEOWJ_002270 [Bacillus cereus]|uniref:hypothetical protein n=1 Tax=Bacillus TaxID=1386 RepID=UPI000A81622F|nr:hypothetical protein [Bacillus sp. UNC322MFChir4.1]